MTTSAIKEVVEFEDIFLQNKIERRASEQREKAIRDYYSYMSAFIQRRRITTRYSTRYSARFTERKARRKNKKRY